MKNLITVLFILLVGIAHAQINDDWSAVKVGDADMTKMYVGENLVWEKLTADLLTDLFLVWAWDVTSDVVADETGNGNDGDVVNTFTTGTGTIEDRMIWLTASNSYAQTATTTDTSSYYSYSVWFKLSSLTSSKFIAYMGYIDAMLSWASASQTLQFAFTQIPSFSLQVNTLYHFVGTRDGYTYKGYLNGDLVIDITKTIHEGSDKYFVIGDYQYSGSLAVDQVAVWMDRVISQDEVTSLYNNGSGIMYQNW